MNNVIDSTDSLFQKVLKEHQSGNIQQTKALYLNIIGRDPTYSDAYQLLGVIQAHKEGDAYDFMLFFQSFNLLQENLNLLE